jgi:Ca2+-binding EF-hand superfamily protein
VGALVLQVSTGKAAGSGCDAGVLDQVATSTVHLTEGTSMDDITAKRLIFAMLDADGDGVISAAEYSARAERVAAATGRTANDPLVVAARTAGQRAWAAMDANGDGGVSFEEYEAWAGARAFDAVCEPVLGGLFDNADTDGDGGLSLAEFTTLRIALGNPVDNIRAAFDVLDTNGDGRISRDEYLASIRAHISGEESPMGEALYSLGTAGVS